LQRSESIETNLIRRSGGQYYKTDYIYGCWRSMTDGFRCILRCIGRIICSFGRRTGMRTYWRMDYVYTDGLRCMLRCIYGCNCAAYCDAYERTYRGRMAYTDVIAMHIYGVEVAYAYCGAYMWRWDSVFVAMR